MNGLVPNSAFGWAFALALLAILVTASYFDSRYRIIPNRLTIPALVAGFVVNVVRFAWLNADQGKSPLEGALSGLVFALLGFLLGFGLFFFFWLIRFCRGGDVKLFAAVASWLGWNCSYWVWLLSFVILATMMTVRLVMRSLGGVKEAAPPPEGEKSFPRPQGRTGPFPGYSLPLTVAVALVLLWLFIRPERTPPEAGAKGASPRVVVVAGASG